MPGASCNRIRETKTMLDGKALMIYVTAEAKNGKANKAMRRLLAKYFDLPITQIHIHKGETSRNKMISIPIKESIHNPS